VPGVEAEVGHVLLFEPYANYLMYAQTEYRPPGSNESEPGDFLEYRIEMWPVQVPAEVRVLKKGRALWTL
jgi:hypothetical protein